MLSQDKMDPGASPERCVLRETRTYAPILWAEPGFLPVILPCRVWLLRNLFCCEEVENSVP